MISISDNTKEITNRLVHLMNYNKPSIIKCMPFQLCNTPERKNLLYTERMEIAQRILSHFNLIFMQTTDKISQFCFDVLFFQFELNFLLQIKHLLLLRP